MVINASPTYQRARREEHKDERRRVLLDAALELFRTSPYADVKMADVAARAGFAKGTVFVYYPTKEALFLALTERLLDEWLGIVGVELESGRGRFTGARIARLLASTLGERPELTRLLAALGTVLEQNVDAEIVLGWKRRLLEKLTQSGALLEKRLSFLAPGEGAHFFLRAHAIVVGLRHLSDAPPVAHAARAADPTLAPLFVEFEPELQSMLELLFAGMERG